MEWYEDPVYIKMCDCPEIQGQHTSWDKHDFYAFADGQNESPYHGIWLPMQAQLQEMVRGEKHCHLLAFEFASCFHGTTDQHYAQSSKDLGVDSDGSMEQMWLAYVMHELHGKTWAGEAWA